jgi:hypothetical protein
MKKRYVVVLALALVLAVTAVAFAVAPSVPDASVGSTGVAMLRLHVNSHVADPVCPPPGMGSCGGG